MALTYQSEKNVTLSRRDGENLIRLHPATVGTQVALTAQNGVTQTDLQKELEAMHGKMDGLLTEADAMQYKGVVNADSELPTTYKEGWTWKVGTAGTYKGKVCEVGDMIIANVDRDGSGNQDADFDVLQTNIDGAVTGPATATSGNLPSFDGATGKVVSDSGISTASVQTAVDFSGKVPSLVVDAVPDSMPEELMEGGVLFVVTPGSAG